MKLLTKYDLDNAGCDDPACGHDHSILYLHSACHPHEAVNVRYEKRRGELIVECHACGRVVARIAPAMERLQ